MISSYCEGFGFEAWIFRFVSILGERYTHGHVYDFYSQLREHPGWLRVLGDGSQRKSYLYVQDCVDAILHVVRPGGSRRGAERRDRVQRGNPRVRARERFDWLHYRRPRVEARTSVYGRRPRGGVGDNPFIFLETAKIRATGWKPRLTIEQGIVRTLRWLEANPWVYADAR